MKPILFSAPMVRAILAGTKTQTRRVVKPQPTFSGAAGDSFEWHGGQALLRAGYGAKYVHTNREPMVRAMLQCCPYGVPGDTLWVRETWQYSGWTEDGYPFITYRADGAKQLHESYDESWAERLTDIWATLSEPSNYAIDQRAADRKWRPAIFLPRWASRLSLRVTAVRCERLHEISYEDAVAEGLGMPDMRFEPVGDGETWEQTARRLRWPQRSFEKLWDGINAKRAPWASNPWVWVITFARVTDGN